MGTNTRFLSFSSFHAPSPIPLLYCSFECKPHIMESTSFPYEPHATCEMLRPPPGFPWSLCNCPPGSLALLQTQPSFSLLSPSTNLRRHKHGTALATAFHLKGTVTMVGALSSLPQCSCTEPVTVLHRPLCPWRQDILICMLLTEEASEAASRQVLSTCCLAVNE